MRPRTNVNFDVGVQLSTAKIRARCRRVRQRHRRQHPEAGAHPAARRGWHAARRQSRSPRRQQRRRVRRAVDRAGAGARQLRQRADLGLRVDRRLRAATRRDDRIDVHLPARCGSTHDGTPPNIEGGTPARRRNDLGPVHERPEHAGGCSRICSSPRSSRDLSTLDLGDRRTGAARTRAKIQNFFRSGAAVRGWVNTGPDGIFGNADDMLIATGETLAQVQDRVLGVGVNSAQL